MNWRPVAATFLTTACASSTEYTQGVSHSPDFGSKCRRQHSDQEISAGCVPHLADDLSSLLDGGVTDTTEYTPDADLLQESIWKVDLPDPPTHQVLVDLDGCGIDWKPLADLKLPTWS